MTSLFAGAPAVAWHTPLHASRNENTLRGLCGAASARWRGLHLRVRVHLLPILHFEDATCVPELWR